jgi:hypothetical protein
VLPTVAETQAALEKWNRVLAARSARSEIATPKKKPPRKGLERERFMRSEEWREVRAFVLERDGQVCSKCATTERIQVDHILPRSKHPELALIPSNLRPLCWPCNKAKGTCNA